jgi:hypothetical protein
MNSLCLSDISANYKEKSMKNRSDCHRNIGPHLFVFFMAMFMVVFGLGFFGEEVQKHGILSLRVIGISFISMLIVGMGGVMAFFSLTACRSEYKKFRFFKNYPDRPWKYDERWCGFTASTHNIADLILYAVIALILWGVSGLILFNWYLGVKVHWVLKILGSISLLYAFLSFVALLDSLLRHLKFGNSTLRLNQIPIPPGTEFEAVLIASNLFEKAEKITYELLCKKTIKEGSGKNSTTKSEKIFSVKKKTSIENCSRIKRKMILPVKLRIPDDGQPDQKEAFPQFEWFLSFQIELPGLDYAAEFPLPVYSPISKEHIEFYNQTAQLED